MAFLFLNLNSLGNKHQHWMEMVEAAGVEPASENVTGQETTCLFRFVPRALGWSACADWPPPGRSRGALGTDKKRAPLA
jgi:hypothetical protein